MKRSELVLKMARYYGTKNCMVEAGYINSMQFCSDMLELIEEMGMLPPAKLTIKCQHSDIPTMYGCEWEPE